MNRDRINNAYFEWLYDLVCGERFSKQISYRKLLMHLHNTEFTYLIPKDENRAEDGIDLRYRFSRSQWLDDPPGIIIGCLEGPPCSVLEMMIGLANRCEEDYMDDPAYGNRTSQWFWEMVTNLDLGSMVDTRYDREYVDEAVSKLLNRKYDPDGRGGLFRVRHCPQDMRHMEIWRQLCYFLDTIM